jgi:hypothetical protein
MLDQDAADCNSTRGLVMVPEERTNSWTEANSNSLSFAFR